MSHKNVMIAIILVLSPWMLNKLFASAPWNATFGGNWQLNVSESRNGASAPAAMNIIQTTDSIIIRRTTGDGVSFTERLGVNGRPCSSMTTSGRKKIGSLQWDSAKESFTETSTLSDVKDSTIVVFDITEHWSLSKEGKKWWKKSISAGGMEMERCIQH